MPAFPIDSCTSAGVESPAIQNGLPISNVHRLRGLVDLAYNLLTGLASVAIEIQLLAFVGLSMRLSQLLTRQIPLGQPVPRCSSTVRAWHHLIRARSAPAHNTSSKKSATTMDDQSQGIIQLPDSLDCIAQV
ncbi:hypothetical protein MJO28_016278 [Puccinia striiformis f. sp. tritici]|uniref:Uncharacterized protein n=1 Tax=Puccinia striiformis f. sp. tritici TaxID=168172 RepID=A0ACC0DMS1_9BASI|nr:hypothetical protein MJO28_016278 [Puccinia striiformis f. sp. tritici]